jgi:choline-sulfatase
VPQVHKLSIIAFFLSLSSHAATQPPVILISIDTLRADHVSAYGYRRIHTPNIDAFAAGGTRFANADAQVPLTMPSHTSFLTSTYPFENRVEENAERLAPGAVTLASVLRGHGYRTAAFVSSVFLEKQMGLDQGFDMYDSPFDYTALSPLSGSMFFGAVTRNPNAGRERRVAALTVRAAVEWLKANRNQPVFLFLHLYDLHKPYGLLPGFKPSPGVTGYDAQLEYVDHVLGSFLKILVDTGWWDRSLVVLLSDHGESLGDHGEASHGYFIYESTLAVPLMFHWPQGAAAHPARVDRPVGLIDVAPSILAALNIQVPPSFEGHNLLDSNVERPVYGESLHSHDSFGWAPLRSLRLGRFKYIQAPRAELYDLQTDPHESRNLLGTQPERARELRNQLAKLLARYPPKPPAQPSRITPETRALLGSLGYLAGGPGVKLDSSGPDPKDRLAEFHLYEDAMVDVYEGRIAGAIAKLRRIVAGDPGNTLARRDLGACYLEQHEYAKARAELERVAQAAPDDYMTQYELGLSFEHLGLIPQAITHLKAACALAPESTQCRHELEAVQKSGAGR